MAEHNNKFTFMIKPINSFEMSTIKEINIYINMHYVTKGSISRILETTPILRKDIEQWKPLFGSELVLAHINEKKSKEMENSHLEKRTYFPKMCDNLLWEHRINNKNKQKCDIC